MSVYQLRDATGQSSACQIVADGVSLLVYLAPLKHVQVGTLLISQCYDSSMLLARFLDGQEGGLYVVLKARQ